MTNHDPIRRHEDVPAGYRHWKNVHKDTAERERAGHDDILVAGPYLSGDENPVFYRGREDQFLGLYVRLPDAGWMRLAEKIMEDYGAGGWLEVQDYQLAELLRNYAEEIAHTRSETRG